MVTVHRVPVADHDLSAATRQVLVAPSVSWTLPVQTYPNPLRWRYRARAGVARRAGSPGDRRLHTSHGVGTPRVQGRRSSSANSKVTTPIRHAAAACRVRERTTCRRWANEPQGAGSCAFDSPDEPELGDSSGQPGSFADGDGFVAVPGPGACLLGQTPICVCPPRSPGRLPERADRVL